MQIFGVKNLDNFAASEIHQSDIGGVEQVEQPDFELSDEQRQLLATHCAGHVVVSHVINPDKEISPLNISSYLDEESHVHPELEENDYQTRFDLLNNIKVAFGGMVAEEFLFGEMSKLSKSDLASATKAAALMVGAYGMGKSLVSCGCSFDDDEDVVTNVLANAQCRDEVDRILTMCKNDTRSILDNNRNLITAVRSCLLEGGKVDNDQFLQVLWSVQSSGARDEEI